ncbi:MAG TPA: sugar ABC transporter ATP-binding protein [Firmicutes bacterium]|uniref:Sugar ABC transporter ATP-binding protein n=2 Tax=Capillibacterium thermochitinicola TaxID=2699427 RepID=A0A8J6I1F6_9FIRM|nr:sugar ABC transporter ATP-binding protein [Capillibacterium thermochitinicola]MBA2132939.1 sugar ABC transporter ATP-binding protein [Capillibacterium thermochitinicola]HHW11897.1 sugar ABC transporter ATP-binding protein [Bacillota bacterium]
MRSDILLKMEGISKSFPGVRALNNVDFTLRRGEIHALMGENGAGKSTLIKIITGVYEKDAGQILIEGRPVQFKSPQDAQNMGIGTVFQEIALCPNLTVAENMFIGRSRGNFVKWKQMNAKAAEMLKSLGIPASPTQELASCSIAVQQMIAIARAVDMDCKILILDEPTSSLDEDEVQKLFALMRELKARGVGIIFITHFIDQVYEISDRITVLRNGELIGEYETTALPQIELISKMMGKALSDVETIKKHAPPKAENNVPVFEAKDLASAAGVKPFNFAIQKGEVNGFAGLLGSGRSESVRAIFAADRVTGGEVKINGNRVKIKTPLDAMKQGIGYLPEDRKSEGIIDELSVRDNIILALQVMKGFFKPLSRKQAEEFANQFVEKLEIKTPSLNTPIKSLSGGNQQKVILARWLLTHPMYLILDEPTRGIDVGTKVEIQKLVLKLAEEGMSLTFISSEIDEMLRVCSRMIVMKDREIIGELSGMNLTEQDVMQMIAQGGK